MMFAVNSGLPELPLGDELHSLEYSPFCRRIAVGTTQGIVHIYDNTSKQAVLIQSIPAKSPAPVRIKWAFSGEIFLAASQAGHVDLYSRSSQNTLFTVSWSNHGLSTPVTSIQFIPLQSPEKSPSKVQSLSFAYGCIDGSITVVSVDPLTSQWNIKKNDDVHILGVTAMTIGQSRGDRCSIWTGGADGFVRNAAINYSGEIVDKWIDFKCSTCAVTDIVTMSGDFKNMTAAIDKNGSLYIFAKEGSTIKGIHSSRPENIASAPRQLNWLSSRRALCTVAPGGLLTCMISPQSGQWKKVSLEEVVGI